MTFITNSVIAEEDNTDIATTLDGCKPKLKQVENHIWTSLNQKYLILYSSYKLIWPHFCRLSFHLSSFAASLSTLLLLLVFSQCLTFIFCVILFCLHNVFVTVSFFFSLVLPLALEKQWNNEKEVLTFFSPFWQYFLASPLSS